MNGKGDYGRRNQTEVDRLPRGICRVCIHPDRESIEETMAGGASYRVVAQQFGISTRSLGRHLLKHRPRPPTPAPESPHAIYAHDIIGWIDAHIKLNELGKPFHLFPFQREILQRMFTFDEDGQLAYDTFIYSAPKKSGKTSLNAVITLWWAFTQEAPNEVYCLSNNREQATERVFSTIVKLIEKNIPLSTGVISQRLEIKLPNETTIRNLASEAAGAAGSNHGLTSWDEIWGYQSESLRHLFDEMCPVPTRQNSIRFITSYAGFTGESQLLEELYHTGVSPAEHPDGQGEAIHPALPLYANVDARQITYWDHEPRLPWQTDSYYAGQRRSLRSHVFLRLHQNRWVTGTEQFISPELWDACVDPGLKPLSPLDKASLFLGVDAAIKHDSACVCGVGIAEADGQVVLALGCHRIWQPTPADPLDIEETIEAYIRELMQRHRVESVYFDPWQLQQMAARLRKANVPIQEFPQTQANLTRMGNELFEALKGQYLVLYPDAQMRAQALQTVAIESGRGWRIGKEKSKHKIDAIISLAMGVMGAVERHGRAKWLPVGS